MRTFMIESLAGPLEMIEIETSEGHFTQMLKSVYEEKRGPIENE